MDEQRHMFNAVSVLYVMILYVIKKSWLFLHKKNNNNIYVVRRTILFHVRHQSYKIHSYTVDHSVRSFQFVFYDLKFVYLISL